MSNENFHKILFSVVELSRLAFQEPDLPVSQKKSDVILAKKTVLIGQVVNGGPLPSALHHTPVCSFDSQNKYRGEGPLAEPPASQFRGIGSISLILTLADSLYFPIHSACVC